MITVSEDTSHLIDRRIYGQFVEHIGRGVYEGLWVGTDSEIPNVNGIRSDVVGALRDIRVPLVRWPGGCFADAYHWLDGVGTERRPMKNVFWGGLLEPNTFGTHEFFELLDQLDAEAYINGNVGSGAVAEMHDWVEYITLEAGTPMADARIRNGRKRPWSLPFFGIGNESWGCGGAMTPLHYANLYRQYQTYVHDHGEQRISRIACGADSDDYQWTEVVMARAGELMDGLSLHFYTRPTGKWDSKGSATEFDERGWYSTISNSRRMEELIERHGKIMDKFDPGRRVSLIVDEWGSWYDREPHLPVGSLYQQNTIRDALVAAITLGIFHRHAYRVRMANVAQMVNVLQAMVLTQGSQMVLTPTYHVFKLHTDHQDAHHVQTSNDQGDEPGRLGLHGDFTISFKDGAFALTVSNASIDEPLTAEFAFPGVVGEVQRAEVLKAPSATSHNTFENPAEVAISPFEDYRVEGGDVSVTLPPHSVATLRLRMVRTT